MSSPAPSRLSAVAVAGVLALVPPFGGVAVAALSPVAPVAPVAPGALQTRDACGTLDACRAAALDAEAAGDGERFHDLAWRVMQLAPKDEPDAMYMVARAQAASGRSSDALVMLRRLAEAGVATDAADLDVFTRVRARDGWPAVETLARAAARRVESPAHGAGEAEVAGAAPTASAEVARTSSGISPDTAADAAGAPAPTAPEEATTEATTEAASAGGLIRPAPVAYGRALPADVALRFEKAPDGLDGLDDLMGGFAYDAVSGRYLVGDREGRRIVVVDEPSRRVADLVRGDSAGFRQLVAMEIDTRRGDLWVLSNDAASGSGAHATVHRLQLIAGRPLARIDAPADAGAVRFTDLAVTAAGAVLVVDAEGRRLYRIDPRGTSLTLVMALDMASLAAVTVAGSDDVAYVAHADGVSRVDLAQRRVVPVTGWADTGTAIDGVWWHEGALVVMRVTREGERRLERWQLNRRGVMVEAIQAVDITLPAAPTPVAVTLSGSSLLVLTDDSSTGGADADTSTPTVRRVRLGP